MVFSQNLNKKFHSFDCIETNEPKKKGNLGWVYLTELIGIVGEGMSLVLTAKPYILLLGLSRMTNVCTGWN